jgi:hypothetical protein
MLKTVISDRLMRILEVFEDQPSPHDGNRKSFDPTITPAEAELGRDPEPKIRI